jgi:hypothetical protein
LQELRGKRKEIKREGFCGQLGLDARDKPVHIPVIKDGNIRNSVVHPADKFVTLIYYILIFDVVCAREVILSAVNAGRELSLFAIKVDNYLDIV